MFIFANYEIIIFQIQLFQFKYVEYRIEMGSMIMMTWIM